MPRSVEYLLTHTKETLVSCQMSDIHLSDWQLRDFLMSDFQLRDFPDGRHAV